MDLGEALDFARRHSQGVLVTLRRDGRPQVSNILYGVDDAGVIRVSVTDSRIKVKNLRRDARASLYIPGHSFWSYVVLDGTAELSDPAAAPDDAVADELVELYRSIRGEEHPDWDEYRQVMTAEGRVVLRLRPVHTYGMVND